VTKGADVVDDDVSVALMWSAVASRAMLGGSGDGETKAF
jgi:hypothetical protein